MSQKRSDTEHIKVGDTVYECWWICSAEHRTKVLTQDQEAPKCSVCKRKTFHLHVPTRLAI